MVGPARGRPTGKPKTCVSEVHPSTPLWRCPDEGPEARGAAERGRGQHVPGAGERLDLRVQGPRTSTGLANGGWAERETAHHQVHCPTVTSSGSIDRGRRRVVGSRPHGRIRELAKSLARRLGLEDERSTGPSRLRLSARRPNPRFAGAGSRGDERPGEHRPVDGTLARAVVRIRERTLEESKAPK